MERQLPVADRGELGGQIADAGECQLPRRSSARRRIDNDSLRHRRRKRFAFAADRQTRLRAGKTIVRKRCRHCEIGQAGQEGHVLRDVERLASAQADDCPHGAGQIAKLRDGKIKVILAHVDRASRGNVRRAEAVVDNGRDVGCKTRALKQSHRLVLRTAEVDPQPRKGAGLDPHEGRDGHTRRAEHGGSPAKVHGQTTGTGADQWLLTYSSRHRPPRRAA